MSSNATDFVPCEQDLSFQKWHVRFLRAHFIRIGPSAASECALYHNFEWPACCNSGYCFGKSESAILPSLVYGADKLLVKLVKVCRRFRYPSLSLLSSLSNAAREMD